MNDTGILNNDTGILNSNREVCEDINVLLI